MSSVFGNRIKVSVFGQSHSEAIGVVIDSLPAGFEPDMEKLRRFTMRRTAIGKEGVTARKEPDEAEILSGLVNGKTCGAPLCAIIRNTDVRSSDYDSLKNKPRPSHADYTAFMKYGESADFHGGGHFSGRLTAPLVFAGGLIIQLLAQRGIRIGARVKSIGNAYDKYIDPAEVSEEILDEIAASDFPSYGDPRAMQKEISDAQTALDSVGGQVECFILGSAPESESRCSTGLKAAYPRRCLRSPLSRESNSEKALPSPGSAQARQTTNFTLRTTAR